MNIEHFDDLLQAARYQPLPQRLLMVFVGVELPADCTEQQRSDFEAGHGGAFVPLMCVDKTPQELDNFSALAAEAEQFSQPWRMVFAAAMSGSPGIPPSSSDAEVPLQGMVDAIKRGMTDSYLLFDTQGKPIRFS